MEYIFYNHVIDERYTCFNEEMDQVSLHLIIFSIFITFTAVVASILGFFGWKELKRTAQNTAKVVAKNTAKQVSNEITKTLKKNIVILDNEVEVLRTKRIREENAENYNKKEETVYKDKE